MNTDAEKRRVSRVTSSAQVLLCKGCCCGQPERGYPAVPVERIKAAWKGEKLNRAVQLTISGCLGPCDLPNVAVIVMASGTTWYGLLDGDGDYDALVDWARRRKAGTDDSSAPGAWAGRTFPRFPGESTAAARNATDGTCDILA